MADKRVGLRDFGEILADLADGEFMKKLTRDSAELMRAVMEIGDSTGELTIKLKVKNDKGKALVKATCEVKKPKEGVASTVFYTADDGSLVKENPRQERLDRDGWGKSKDLD